MAFLKAGLSASLAAVSGLSCSEGVPPAPGFSPIDLHPSICRPWFSAVCHGIQVTCVYVKQVLETSVFPRKESSFWLETHVRDARCVCEGLRGEALGSLGTRPHSER